MLLIGAAFGIRTGRRRRAAPAQPGQPGRARQACQPGEPRQAADADGGGAAERGTVTAASPREPVQAIGYA